MTPVHVYLDTSVYRALNFHYKGERFRTLAHHACAGRVVVLYSEVIEVEVRDKIREGVEEARESLSRNNRKKAHILQNVSRYRPLFQRHDWESIEKELVQQFYRFLKEVSAQKVSTEICGGALLRQYGNLEPPFSPGKRNEFPDAIALSMLRRWSHMHGHAVFVVSRDPDMRVFCENDEHLTYAEDLTTLFEHLGFERIEPSLEREAELARQLQKGRELIIARQGREKHELEQSREAEARRNAKQLSFLEVRSTLVHRLNKSVEALFDALAAGDADDSGKHLSAYKFRLREIEEALGVKRATYETGPALPIDDAAFAKLLEEVDRLGLKPILTSGGAYTRQRRSCPPELQDSARQYNSRLRVLVKAQQAWAKAMRLEEDIGFVKAYQVWSQEVRFYFLWFWYLFEPPNQPVKLGRGITLTSWSTFRHCTKARFIAGPNNRFSIDLLADLVDLYRIFGYEAERLYRSERVVLIAKGKAA